MSKNNLNQDKLNAMKFKILKLEQLNLKTREKTNEQMVDAIRKIISDEIGKAF